MNTIKKLGLLSFLTIGCYLSMGAMTQVQAIKNKIEALETENREDTMKKISHGEFDKRMQDAKDRHDKIIILKKELERLQNDPRVILQQKIEALETENREDFMKPIHHGEFDKRMQDAKDRQNKIIALKKELGNLQK